MTYRRALARYTTLIAIGWLTAFAQSPTYPYVLKAFAGSNPLGDGGMATQALLSGPSALALDGLGNTFILDANNLRIRKISLFGVISTVTSTGIAANDMKMGKDGAFYLTANALVFKISPTGAVSVIAGNGAPGSSMDGIPATSAQIGLTGGIALDAAGNVYFVDGNRVREVTADGIIHTVAGTASGYLYNGDNKLAIAANLYAPWGIAIDSSNNLYIADQGNSRVRKVSGGMISTFAGNGSFGMPATGSAFLLPLGSPYGMTLDSAGAVYITDSSFNLALKITASGTMTQLAGTQTFGYTDGVSNASYLNGPAGLAVDINGNVFIAEQVGNRVREVTGGNLSTIAGRLHYGGDGAAATSALLNQPVDLSLDGQGDVFIADGNNFRIREVAPNGLIGTYAGSGIPNLQVAPGTGAAVQLPPMIAMASDAKGNLYLASLWNILKIGPGGAVSNFAGNGSPGDSGDGGPASKAMFALIGGVAVDASGNVYVSDSFANRVRKISAIDGTIAPFAGTGKTGYTGDGALATSGTLNLSGLAPLTVDPKGSVYIGDNGNNVIRVVAPSGVIGTAVGNGSPGSPADGSIAKSSVFAPASALAVDSTGALYIASHVFPALYELDPAGILHLISGAGTAVPTDGAPANSTFGFGGGGLRVDANSDLFVTDPADGLVWKLVLNSPVTLAIFGGNGQTAAAGSLAPQALQVMVNGRAGVGVPGVTVNFAVLSGSATLSAKTSQTDTRGLAGVGVTLGSAAGNAMISATITGSTLPPVQFTLTTADSLTLNPQSLTFSYNLGDPTPAPQPLGISSGSNAAIPFTTGIAVAGGVLWLQIDTANGNTPAAAQVGVVIDSLGAGVYQGSITVTSPNAIPASLSVPVTLTVVDPSATAPSAVKTRVVRRH